MYRQLLRRPANIGRTITTRLKEETEKKSRPLKIFRIHEKYFPSLNIISRVSKSSKCTPEV